jgi:hypothetical protein
VRVKKAKNDHLPMLRRKAAEFYFKSEGVAVMEDWIDGRWDGTAGPEYGSFIDKDVLALAKLLEEVYALGLTSSGRAIP